MKWLVVTFCLLILTAACNGSRFTQPVSVDSSENTILITGTIQYLPFEGGFYGIIGDDGKKYDPVNLTSQFAVDGLRVKVQARIIKDAASIHMWGKIIEIMTINRL